MQVKLADHTLGGAGREPQPDPDRREQPCAASVSPVRGHLTIGAYRTQAGGPAMPLSFPGSVSQAPGVISICPEGCRDLEGSATRRDGRIE